MTLADIESTIEEYARSSELAIEAGFDGVELHGANGYLIEHFLNTASNERSDASGGTIENRIRFAVEIAARTAARIGGDRLGMRLSRRSDCVRPQKRGCPSVAWLWQNATVIRKMP